MYKFTKHLANANLVLVRKPVGDGTYATLIVMRSPARQYSKDHFSEKCPPPPPPRKSRALLYGTLGALITGSAVVYAKHSPDTRNWLESNAPWASNFVALVYQEDTTYWKFSVNHLSKIKDMIHDFMFGKEGISPLDFPSRAEQDLDKDAIISLAPKEYKLPPPTLEPLYVEEKVIGTPEVDTPATLIQTEKCDPEPPLVVNITKDIVELEKEMHENTKAAIDNYKNSLKHIKEYNTALHRIVESSIEDLDKKNFSTLRGAFTEQDKLVNAAKKAAEKAKSAIDAIETMIKESRVEAPPENVTVTQRYIKQFRADLAAAEKQVKEEIDKAVLSDKYWSKVEAARNMYKDELQMLFPGIDLSARSLDIKGDTDLLLLYTMRQVQYLQNELAELQTIREQKINRAIECNDEKAIIEAKVEDMIKKERLAREMEFQKKALETTAQAHAKMKEQLKYQYEAQQNIMKYKLEQKEKEIMYTVSRTVSEQMEKDNVAFKKELAAMAGKLRAIEATLKQRAAAEAEARRSQSLWAAAEALLAATRRPDGEAKIDNEFKALQKAGKDDKVVQTVLKGIPSEVIEKGIATENSLRDRFEKLEKTALKVALIGREGATLPMYFLSWVQSKLLFQKFAEIPKDELENRPTDFSKLDTFDIIQRARYHMDHGNLAIALRYVNLLQGAPRVAAKCWADAARRHLEIKQAAETVMAHASLSGLLYL